MPTFTNPNNVSIVTGAPPSVHGIAGNYYLDRDSGREIMMTDDRPDAQRDDPRADGAGRRQDRGDHRQGQIAQAARAQPRRHLLFVRMCRSPRVEALVGRGRPDMYSADLSLFVLDAGIALLERGTAELLYLSLSDYVQHAHAPGEPEADAFNRAIDDRVRRFVELGARRRSRRRSRHERQGAARRRAQCDFPRRRAQRAVSAPERCG